MQSYTHKNSDAESRSISNSIGSSAENQIDNRRSDAVGQRRLKKIMSSENATVQAMKMGISSNRKTTQLLKLGDKKLEVGDIYYDDKFAKRHIATSDADAGTKAENRWKRNAQQTRECSFVTGANLKSAFAAVDKDFEDSPGQEKTVELKGLKYWQVVTKKDASDNGKHKVDSTEEKTGDIESSFQQSDDDKKARVYHLQA